jgi:RNA polymerase sigma-70 factor (ECF subfamily)
LTESTFLHVWKDLRARKRKTEIRNFSAWLYRVAHNLVIDHHRKKRPAQIYQDTTSQITQTAIPGTEEVVISKIDNQILANALEKLEATAQNVIILRFFNGLSHGETAEALELNEGNVRVIQYRALKRLREILNKDNYD